MFTGFCQERGCVCLVCGAECLAGSGLVPMASMCLPCVGGQSWEEVKPWGCELLSSASTRLSEVCHRHRCERAGGVVGEHGPSRRIAKNESLARALEQRLRVEHEGAAHESPDRWCCRGRTDSYREGPVSLKEEGVS
jgi:hypothetical protein